MLRNRCQQLRTKLLLRLLGLLPELRLLLGWRLCWAGPRRHTGRMQRTGLAHDRRQRGCRLSWRYQSQRWPLAQLTMLSKTLRPGRWGWRRGQVGCDEQPHMLFAAGGRAAADQENHAHRLLGRALQRLLLRLLVLLPCLLLNSRTGCALSLPPLLQLCSRKLERR